MPWVWSMVSDHGGICLQSQLLGSRVDVQGHLWQSHEFQDSLEYVKRYQREGRQQRRERKKEKAKNRRKCLQATHRNSQPTALRKWTRDTETGFPQENIQMASRPMQEVQHQQQLKPQWCLTRTMQLAKWPRRNSTRGWWRAMKQPLGRLMVGMGNALAITGDSSAGFWEIDLQKRRLQLTYKLVWEWAEQFPHSKQSKICPVICEQVSGAFL